MRTTPEAEAVIARADAAARRLNPDARVRLSLAGSDLVTSLCEGPGAGEEWATVGGADVVVPSALAGTVDVEEPHDRLVLRPPARA